jgi:protocatechuate 3,4-dioxygenase, beta subunit
MNRRQFSRRFLIGGASLWVPGVFAEELAQTAKMTEGPFYPDKLPLDTDNDLLVINEGLTPAIGEVAHLSGRVLMATGAPVRNAMVEIWQCDQNGVYLHSKGGSREKMDGNFQGFGRFLTDAEGRYYFRTIKPSAYVGRTPHIHVAVEWKGKRVLTSQILIDGHEGNEADILYQRLKTDRAKSSVLAKFLPIEDTTTGECQARFDIVLGVMPEA